MTVVCYKYNVLYYNNGRNSTQTNPFEYKNNNTIEKCKKFNVNFL